MPVSVVVGGQYGSEGKGKVALDLVRRDPAITFVVRPGGTNSGHTGYSRDGRRIVLRQLPAAAIDGGVKVVLPAGSYIDVQVLLREIAEISLPTGNLIIDPRAQIIRAEHVEWERHADLAHTIGSTNSGTGAAVIARLARYAPQLPEAIPAAEASELRPYVTDAVPLLRAALRRNERVLIEGTQGFGLSPLHGDAWPKATSRDTTAAAFVSEAGLSPRDVDRVILVVRAHPIRVAGDSGPLAGETSWEAIARDAEAPTDLREFTSVTQKLRRVGMFSGELVKRAIAANQPTSIVLNHLDHIDWHARHGLTPKAKAFVASAETAINHEIAWLGLGPECIQEFSSRQVRPA